MVRNVCHSHEGKTHGSGDSPHEVRRHQGSHREWLGGPGSVRRYLQKLTEPRKSTSRRLSRATCVDEADDVENSRSRVNVVVFHVEQGTPGVLEVAIRSRFPNRSLAHSVTGIGPRRSSAQVRRGCTARHDRPMTIQTNVYASDSAFHKFRDCLSRRLQPARTVNGDQDSQKIATSRGVRSAARVRVIVALFMKHGTDPPIERPSHFNQA